MYACTLQPETRRRHNVTTDSQHGGLSFPNLARDLEPGARDQLWIVEISRVAIRTRVAHLAIVLDS